MDRNLHQGAILKVYAKNKDAVTQVIFVSQYFGSWVGRLWDGFTMSPIVIFSRNCTSQALRPNPGDYIKVKKMNLVSKADSKINVIQFTVPHLVIDTFEKVSSSAEIVNCPKAEDDYMRCLEHVIAKLSGSNSSFNTFFLTDASRLKQHESNAEDLRLRGNTLFKKDKYEEALLCYENASKLRNCDSRIHSNKAITLMKLKKYTESENSAHFALLLSPSNRKAYKYLCEAMIQNSKRQRAYSFISAFKFMFGTGDKDLVLMEKLFDSADDSINSKENILQPIPSTPNIMKPKEIPEEKIKKTNPPRNKNLKQNEDVKLKIKAEKPLEVVHAPGYDSPDISTVYMLLLTKGRDFYLNRDFIEAYDFYDTILNSTHTRDQKEKMLVCLIQFICCVEQNTVSSSIKVLTHLEELLETNASSLCLPSSPIHYLLSKAYYFTYQPNLTKNHISQCLSQLEMEKNKLPLKIPGFFDPIRETEYAFISEWCHNGLWKKDNSLEKVGVCRFVNCNFFEQTGYHQFIVRDKKYKGHVHVSCENDCNILYHVTCWKSFKEMLNADFDKRSRKNDKDFLKSKCFTPDCSGLIYLIDSYNASNTLMQHFEAVIKPEPKTQEKSVPESPKHVSKSDSSKKKPKRSIKKTSIAQENSESTKNSSLLSKEEDRKLYQMKLSDLHLKKEEIFSEEYRRSQLINPPLINLRKPYYTPELLAKNPNELISFYANRTHPGDDFQYGAEPKFSVYFGMVNKLVQEMKEYIECEGIVHVECPRLKKKVESVCDDNMLAYIDYCGGIVKLLMRSIDFVLIDDSISTTKYVISKSESVVREADARIVLETHPHPKLEKKKGAEVKDAKFDASESLVELSSDSDESDSEDYSTRENLICNNRTVPQLASESYEEIYNSELKTNEEEESEEEDSLEEDSVENENDSNVDENDSNEDENDSNEDENDSIVEDSEDDDNSFHETEVQSSDEKDDIKTDAAASVDTISIEEHNKLKKLNGILQEKLTKSMKRETDLKTQMEELSQKLESALKQRDQEATGKKTLNSKLANMRNEMTLAEKNHKAELAEADVVHEAKRKAQDKKISQQNNEIKRLQSDRQKRVEELKSLSASKNAMQLSIDEKVAKLDQIQRETEHLVFDISKKEKDVNKLRQKVVEKERQCVELAQRMGLSMMQQALRHSRQDQMRLTQLLSSATNITSPSFQELYISSTILQGHISQLEMFKDGMEMEALKALQALNRGDAVERLDRFANMPDQIFSSVTRDLLFLGLQSGIIIPHVQKGPNTSNEDQYLAGGDNNLPRDGYAAQADGVPASAHDFSDKSTANRKLFIGRIHKSVTDTQLMDFLNEITSVESVQLFNSKSAYVNHAYVLFWTQSDRDKLLETYEKKSLSLFGLSLNLSAFQANSRDASSSRDSSVSSDIKRNVSSPVSTASALPSRFTAVGSTKAKTNHYNSLDQFDDFDQPRRSGSVRGAPLPIPTNLSRKSSPHENSNNRHVLSDALMKKCRQVYKHKYSMDDLKAAYEEVLHRSASASKFFTEEEFLAQVGKIIGRRKAPKTPSVAPWANILEKETPKPYESCMTSESDECAICLVDMSDRSQLTQLDCMHWFHTNCIESWQKEKQDCPYCRTYSANKKEFPSLS